MKYQAKPLPDVEDKLRALTEAVAEGAPIATVTKRYCGYMLSRMGGNKVHTALRLGLDRRTVQRWAKSGDLGPMLPTKRGRPDRGAVEAE